MKKLLILSLAFFILLSGMNLSVARHFCGGEIADVKLSFSGAKASCGMESDENNCAEHGIVPSSCCSNDLSVFLVDNYFGSSNLQIKEVSQPVSQLFYLPLIQSLYSQNLTSHFYSDASLPDNLIVREVSLPKICVFRI